PADGSSLVWSESEQKWIAGTPVQSLDDLTDVKHTYDHEAGIPRDNSSLVWDADTGQWVPGRAWGIGSGIAIDGMGIKGYRLEWINNGHNVAYVQFEPELTHQGLAEVTIVSGHKDYGGIQTRRGRFNAVAPS